MINLYAFAYVLQRTHSERVWLHPRWVPVYIAVARAYAIYIGKHQRTQQYFLG